ncbi:MAG: MerR family transcriptional regulator [Odoribacteraceae bacterium]|jgi:DNA-binding transcriptional MerR regulator|nr:MerR family transcriptional regulator [Odoribacteraceae bacterium]
MTEKQVKKVSIGKVSEMFGVDNSLIRYWEEETKAFKPERNKKGDRRFSPADIDTIRLIYHLVKERGMTLKGVRAQLKDRRKETERVFEIVKRLKQIKEQLLAIQNKLPAATGRETKPEK